MAKLQLTQAEHHALQALRTEILHWEKQGVHSLSKMAYLIELMLHEGASMSELAQKSNANRYNQIMQAMLDLGPGRAGHRARIKPPNLVSTVPDASNGRLRRIQVTGKGRRLQQRMLSFIGCR